MKVKVAALVSLMILCALKTDPPLNNNHQFWNQYSTLPGMITAGFEGPVYHSVNLSGHEVFAECFNQGNSSCQCDQSDAALVSYADYGTVTANPGKRFNFVNAIGFKKFTGSLTPEIPVRTDVYCYTAEVRLPVLPSDDITSQANPQNVHIMIQLYDGNNTLWNKGKITREATIYWDLNPWNPSEYGKIKIYVDPITLYDTDIRLNPDLNWHTFEIKADFVNCKYISVKIDDQSVSLSSQSLASVSHDDWDNTNFLSITTESGNASNDCDKIFYWETQFRNINLYTGSICSATGQAEVPNIPGISRYGMKDAANILKIYPNPSSGHFEIVQMEPAAKINRIEIYNSSGMLFKTCKRAGNSSRYSLDLSGAPAGEYLVKAITGKGSSVVRVVKR